MKNIACLLTVVVCCASAGCTAMNDSRDMGHAMVNSMFPAPEDRADTHQDENRVDREHEDMMRDARKGMSTASEPDGWWFNKIMSPKARSIERSLGVELQ